MDPTAEIARPMATAARWAGRISSLVSLAVLSMFVAGEPPWPWRLSAFEAGLLLCFPLTVAAGMILAWWREGLGALLTFLGLLAFHALLYIGAGRWSAGPWFLVFASPAFFFLASWALRRGFRRGRPGFGPKAIGTT